MVGIQKQILTVGMLWHSTDLLLLACYNRVRMTGILRQIPAMQLACYDWDHADNGYAEEHFFKGIML